MPLQWLTVNRLSQYNSSWKANLRCHPSQPLSFVRILKKTPENVILYTSRWKMFDQRAKILPKFHLCTFSSTRNPRQLCQKQNSSSRTLKYSRKCLKGRLLATWQVKSESVLDFQLCSDSSLVKYSFAGNKIERAITLILGSSPSHSLQKYFATLQKERGNFL